MKLQCFLMAPIISVRTRPIFTKLSGLVHIWLEKIWHLFWDCLSDVAMKTKLGTSAKNGIPTFILRTGLMDWTTTMILGDMTWQQFFETRSIWKMLGPFATASHFTLPFTRCRYCRTPPLSHAACASMSTTTTTTTTTTRVRGERNGPIEWAQSDKPRNLLSYSVGPVGLLLEFTRLGDLLNGQNYAIVRFLCPFVALQSMCGRPARTGLCHEF